MILKSRYVSETFRPGDTRIKRTFAWLPFRINNDLVWLEKYETLQSYILTQHEAYVSVEGELKLKAFQVYEWINLSHRIITK